MFLILLQCNDILGDVCKRVTSSPAQNSICFWHLNPAYWLAVGGVSVGGESDPGIRGRGRGTGESVWVTGICDREYLPGIARNSSVPALV